METQTLSNSERIKESFLNIIRSMSIIETMGIDGSQITLGHKSEHWDAVEDLAARFGYETFRVMKNNAPQTVICTMVANTKSPYEALEACYKQLRDLEGKWEKECLSDSPQYAAFKALKGFSPFFTS